MVIVEIVAFREESLGRPRPAGLMLLRLNENSDFYRLETLLCITCQIIFGTKHPRFCFPRFVSVWPAPEVVDGICEARGGDSYMKQTRMLVVSLRGVNFGFWSRLECSGQSANILSRQGLV